MLDVGTKIPTPSGWTTMGELAVGDEIFTEKGHICRVIAVHDIDETPESFHMEFDDGSVIRACADHLWLTFDSKELAALTRRSPEYRAKRRANRVSKVSGRKSLKFTLSLQSRNRTSNRNKILPLPKGTIRTTMEIAKSVLTSRGRKNHAIPVAKALRLPEKPFTISPYVLGVWLGDGNSSGPRITTMDKEVVQYIREEGERVGRGVISKSKACDYCIHGGKISFVSRLRKLGVLRNKHVPHSYLRGSKEQRLALLQGLMDTDGTVDRSGGVSFTNTNKRLINAAKELVVSLGWKAFITERRAKLYGKDCGPVWTVSFTPDAYVFRLNRKKDRQRIDKRRRTNNFRYVVSCRKIAPRPMRCITVDNPTGLYLVGRSMIPTHNTAVLIGLAITRHHRSLILRRNAVNTPEIVDQLKRYTFGSGASWRGLGYGGTMTMADGRTIEIGGCDHEDDKEKYQGRPHDGLFFDEVPHFTKSQVRFISAWNRHENPKQRCRIVLAGNPPTTPEGRWIIEEYAPWLDKDKFPVPLRPGELKWYSVIKDEITWRENGDPFMFEGQLITPRSRTFIPALLSDNPILAATDYGARLQALDEPLRSQLLFGDMNAGTQDNEWQVIPTEWVRQAMRRWTPEPPGPQEGLGVDVARGGKDKLVITPRHGKWFGHLKKYPGTQVPDGDAAANLVIKAHQNDAVVYVDVIGIGSSCYDCLKKCNWFKTVPINNAESRSIKSLRDKSGRMPFVNVRAASYWKMREDLDPNNTEKIALPPDNEMLADLCAAHYTVTATGISVEKKEEIIERLGRSPDCGDSVVLANWSGRQRVIGTLRVFSEKPIKGILRFLVCSASELSAMVIDDKPTLFVSIGDPNSEMPPHGFHKLLDSVSLSFIDDDPADYESTYDELVEPYGKKIAELVMQKEQGKKLWSLLLKKRDPAAQVWVFQDDGDDRALSMAFAVCDALRLDRDTTIYRPSFPENKYKGETAPNRHVYQVTLSSRSMVI